MLILPAHVVFFPISVSSHLYVMLCFCVLSLYLKPYVNGEGDMWSFFFSGLKFMNKHIDIKFHVGVQEC